MKSSFYHPLKNRVVGSISDLPFVGTKFTGRMSDCLSKR